MLPIIGYSEFEIIWEVLVWREFGGSDTERSREGGTGKAGSMDDVEDWVWDRRSLVIVRVILGRLG